ncbi:MAG: hypothetical protein N2606_07185 [Candidatus Omnitrophica bacterium]|nr:hypothetical protein [Candidatus Omnitrophota bacterium]
MKKIIGLVLLNVIQGVREKIFWLAVGFFIFLLALSFFMGILSVGETAQVLRCAGLSGIELSCILLVVSSMLFGIYREREGRLTEFLLSHFSRINYISGKFLGYIMIAGCYILLCAIGWFIILIFEQAFHISVIMALVALYSKIILVIGWGLVFSMIFSSSTIALFATLFIYLASEVAYETVRIMMLSKQTFITVIIKGIYYLLPAMDKIDLKTQATFGNSVPLSFLWWLFIYTALYGVFLWCMAVYLFLKKEI